MIKSPTESFVVNPDKKIISFTKEIGVLSFYQECMEMFSRSEFMDLEIPIIEKDGNIYSTGEWDFKNIFFIVSQEVVKVYKPRLDRYSDEKFVK